MTQYDVIESISLSALIEEVNKCIRVGWKPQGGICHVVNDNNVGNRYCQAMVLEKK